MIHAPPIGIYALVEDLDLAILDVAAPQGAPSLRVEWDKEEISPLSPLYVVGFPQIPDQALVPMICRSTELAGPGMSQRRRETYLIKSATSLGFSGGPAINSRGRVVGVVQGMPDDPESTAPEQAQYKQKASNLNLEEMQVYDSDYSVLTPAFLLEELEPSLREKKLVIMDGDSFL